MKKKKVIKILINQIEKYCHKTHCCECICYHYEQDCLLHMLQENNPCKLVKYLYTLDKGLEVFNNEKD